MGNTHQNTQLIRNSPKSNRKKESTMELVHNFKFLKTFEELSPNGLYFDKIYLPEEVVENILSYVPENQILSLTLVCKRWCNIIKSENLWMCKYNRTHHDKAKKLPWYVFYCYFTTDSFKNLLKNGNGQEEFRYWMVVKNSGDKFKIEKSPIGADPLPVDVSDFNGITSCFVTSFDECSKMQEISLRPKRLLRYILTRHMPHLYVSEWTAGRFDCGSRYQLGIKGYGSELTGDHDADFLAHALHGNAITPLFYEKKEVFVNQWEGSKWQKVELLVTQYDTKLQTLLFDHLGCDTQFWKGHYGSKMAGGVVKFLLNSIQPLEKNDEESASLLEDL